MRQPLLLLYYLFKTSSAFLTKFSIVNPNSLNNTSPGADAPKWSIDRMSPSKPKYLCHPKEDAASTANLFVTFDGKTSSLYSLLCFSNTSKEGMLTTLTLIPFSSSILAPSYISSTSEPVAIRIISGFLSSVSFNIYAPFRASLPVSLYKGKFCLDNTKDTGPSSLVIA
ncbi:phosphate transport system permease protein pstA [Clostridium tetani E88]|uniref:Phosphate transport system permease protein pstA n=1 Tax=Clostridium tetani (strain Massachusetts / E88) TaxID=212717 RepID=Q895E5_CLOTE|nr:phosphate transport system permease protein pstA [Clostridium tetani E88]